MLGPGDGKARVEISEQAVDGLLVLPNDGLRVLVQFLLGRILLQLDNCLLREQGPIGIAGLLGFRLVALSRLLLQQFAQ